MPNPSPKPAPAAPVAPSLLTPPEFVGLALGPVLQGNPPLAMPDAENPYGCSRRLSSVMYSLWRTYSALCDIPEPSWADEDAFNAAFEAAWKAQVDARAAKVRARLDRERIDAAAADVKRRAEEAAALAARAAQDRRMAGQPS